MNSLRISFVIGFLSIGGTFAAPFQNGSFEFPGGAPIRQGLGCNDTFVTGWVHNASVCTGFEIYESSNQDGIPAGAGNYYVSWGHNASTGGTLQQTFDTLIGTTYTINYLLTTQQGTPVTQTALVEALNGSTVLSSTTNNFSPLNGTWISGNTLTFTAVSTSSTLRFTDQTTAANSGSINWGLDAVTVSAPSGVPEPASCALLFVGLLGLAVRGKLTRN